MSQFFQIHPDNPQIRLVKRAAELIREGAVVIYPTDSAYALGCHLGDRKALERIMQLRAVDKHHNFTLMCRDLSELGTYAKVDNSTFRLLKANTPGAYTFVLPGTSEVPKRLLHEKRKSIGLRIPDNRIALAILEELDEPLLTSTLILAGENEPLNDPYDIRDRLEHQVDLIIDGGYCGLEPTTVVDLRDGAPVILREGAGSVSALGL
ncbi:MAG: threonylcarbamoyl-AMP synthase [Cellvibrionales bacterium]|jgi:tRNA threonylcarbamoyl adenosine modification protein (Sua5/YciO/YrdC/YwlC family)|nr:threonylcarbamoyl-AMP synthase [Cellvibrionales bacterium]